MITRNRKLVIAAVTAVLAAAGGATWWYASRPTVPDPPPIPEHVTDPNVQAKVTEARDAVVKEPRSAAAWGEYGLVCRGNGLAAESNVCFAQAARLDPNDARWPYLIGLLNLRVAPDDALPHLREAYRLATASEFRSAARLRLAELHQDRGEFDEAERLYTEELRENKNAPRAQFGLGTAALACGDVRAAVERLEQAVTSPPARKKASALLAVAYRRLGDLDAATRHEREAARAPADPGWPDPFLDEYLRKQVGWTAGLDLAAQYEAQGRFRDALAVYDDLARKYPDDQALVKLGAALARLNQLGRAEEIFRSVLRSNPNNGTAHYLLGRSLLGRAEPVARRTDGAPEGQLRELMEEALGEFRRAAELRPDYAPAFAFAGQTLRLLRRLPEAEAVSRDAVRIAPQEAEAHLVLGEVLLDAGKSSEAVREAEEAARLAPNDPRPKELLAKAKK